MNFLENEFFLLAVTFGIFFLAKLLQKKTGIMLLNPILLTIAILIVFLKMTLSGSDSDPCVMCNPLFKFRILEEWADKLGCAYIATGHYTRLEERNGKVIS